MCGFEVSSGQVSRLSKELDVGIFPNQESCLRLIIAVLEEIHEGWIVGRKYINFENDKTEESFESQFYRKKIA